MQLAFPSLKICAACWQQIGGRNERNHRPHGRAFHRQGHHERQRSRQGRPSGRCGYRRFQPRGRVLDQSPATAEVLPEIAAAVGGKVKIFVDGGIRTGVDVFKALALGADAVLIARPFVNAVYGGGKEGVRCLVDKLGAELKDTMEMCGAATLREITGEMIRR